MGPFGARLGPTAGAFVEALGSGVEDWGILKGKAVRLASLFASAGERTWGFAALDWGLGGGILAIGGSMSGFEILDQVGMENEISLSIFWHVKGCI